MTRIGLLAAIALAACRFGFGQPDQPDQPDAALVPPKEPVPAYCPARPFGTNYFASPTGSDGSDGLTRDTPWATFAKAWSVMTPGDTLTLLDGTYQEPLAPTVSGLPDRDVRVCAEHDGGVTIDGAWARVPCALRGTSDAEHLRYVTIEGIICRRSNAVSIVVVDSDHIVLRRVSAYDSATDADSVVEVYQVTDSLFEEMAVMGPGSGLALTGANRNTVRRLWTHWVSSVSFYSSALIVQWSAGNVVENCISTSEPSPSNYVGGFPLYVANNNVGRGNIAWAPPGGELDAGFSVSAGVEQTSGNRIESSVAIGPYTGVSQRSDRDVVLDRVTLVNAMSELFTLSATSEEPKVAGHEVGVTLTNSVLLGSDTGIAIGTAYVGSVQHRYNTLFAITTPYWGTNPDATERIANPEYDVATYGPGAYLIAPAALAGTGAGGSDVGADVRFRIVDGTVTDVPLWPWPMEERIARETGRSVTWAGSGGLWATLDGVYP